MKMPEQAVSMKRPSWDITLGELRDIDADGVAIDWGPDCFDFRGVQGVVIPGGRVPTSCWLSKGAEWAPSDKSDSLPTFVSCQPRRRPGSKPAGINRCTEEDLARWRAHHR